MSTRIISLDIESYGLFKHSPTGTPYPPQKHGHPQRCLIQDKVKPLDLAPLCSITKVSDPGHRPLTAEDIASFRPLQTFTLQLWIPSHLRILQRWLRHADTILGMFLNYDFLMLREAFPSLCPELSGRHQIIDLSVLNYLENELRPEGSLKTLGPVLGTHIYSEDQVQGTTRTTYPNPQSQAAQSYNQQDTHNTVLAIAELATRILRTHGSPQTPTGKHLFTTSCKLSKSCLDFYSESFWQVLRMTEDGIPISRPHLQTLHTHLEKKTSALAHLARTCFSLILEGQGTPASKSALIDRCLQHCPPTTLERLSRTPITKQIQFSDENRLILSLDLPETPTGRHLRRALQIADLHASNQKLLSTYTYPLLHHKRNDPEDTSSLALPTRHPDIIRCFPSWFLTPGRFHESSDTSGGTKQGRITCKNPSAQTWPPPIISLIRSGSQTGAIVCFDLSQVELRAAGLLSGEPSIIGAYADPTRDIHTERAITSFTLPYLVNKYGPDFARHPVFRKDQKGERQTAKTLNFADLFLSSPETMQAQVFINTKMLLPLSFFEQIANSRPTVRPVLYAWQQSLIETARRTGILHMPITGQSRYFHLKEKKGRRLSLPTNEIVNFPVQTTAGNMGLRLKHLLAKHLPSLALPRSSRTIHLIHNIYDSLWFDCRTKSDTDRLLEVIPKAFQELTTVDLWGQLQDLTGNTVPLLYEIKVIPAEAS